MFSILSFRIRKNHRKPPQMASTECPRTQYSRRSHLENPIPKLSEGLKIDDFQKNLENPEQFPEAFLNKSLIKF